MRWARGGWRFSGFAGGSSVLGSAEAVAALQRNPVHRFQRPDARRLVLDTTRTSLVGWAAQLRLGRQTGPVQGHVAFYAWSPGMDINDAG
ncbi:hypothetical protein, partial [Klebsiella pneumoniae]|uniref:hypothetical protein n=1 Tax=Klebsiella pneumoniae TaxID=573 RepID=UPI0034E96C7E